MSDFSSQAVIEFLNFAANKGLINKATANAKRVAVERVFATVDDVDRQDVRQIDIETLMHRFINLAGSEFKPESLASYQSRVKSAIEEFLTWKQNPIAFKPGRRAASSKAKNSVRAPKANSTSELPVRTGMPAVPVQNTHVVPIPIRQDLTVLVQGLPFDLTKAEASKVANVILAMASEYKT